MPTPTSNAARTKDQRRAQFLAFIQSVSPEVDPTSVLLFRQVRKADHLLTRAAEKELELAGLSWPRFMLLMALQGNESNGSGRGLHPSELSELQGIPRNSVSELLAGLEEDGLISRELHGTDHRRFLIRLTPQGRKTLKSKLGTQFRQIAKCFATFNREERATLLELLTRLIQSLTEMNN